MSTVGPARLAGPTLRPNPAHSSSPQFAFSACDQLSPLRGVIMARSDPSEPPLLLDERLTMPRISTLRFLHVSLLLFLLASFSSPLTAAEPGDLRLVPFPKQCQPESGVFALRQTLTLEVPAGQQQVLALCLMRNFRRRSAAGTD